MYSNRCFLVVFMSLKASKKYLLEGLGTYSHHMKVPNKWLNQQFWFSFRFFPVGRNRALTCAGHRYYVIVKRRVQAFQGWESNDCYKHHLIFGSLAVLSLHGLFSCLFQLFGSRLVPVFFSSNCCLAMSCPAGLGAETISRDDFFSRKNTPAKRPKVSAT